MKQSKTSPSTGLLWLRVSTLVAIQGLLVIGAVCAQAEPAESGVGNSQYPQLFNTSKQLAEFRTCA